MTNNQNKMLLVGLVIFFLTTASSAQITHHNIAWDKKSLSFPGNFEGAQADFFKNGDYYPIWVYSELSDKEKFDVEIFNEIYEPVTAGNEVIENFKTIKHFEFANAEERGTNRLKIKIVPFRVNNQTLERLVSFDLGLKKNGVLEARLNKKGNKTQSVLATGEWYKLKIKDDAVYKLDKTFFAKHSINSDNIDLRTFKVYGNGGLMLPEIIFSNRDDDLVENAIKIQDVDGDNKLDDGDFISFYGKGTESWKEQASDYIHEKNVFSEHAFYFITWGGGFGKRLSESGAGENLTPQITITESDYLFVHEVDEVNFRNSGREWFGEVLTIDTKSIEVTVPDIINSPNNFIRSEVAGRTAIGTFVNMYLNGSLFIDAYINPVNYETDDNFANVVNKQKFFNALSPFNLKYEFIRPQLGSEAWINYFEVQCKRKLKPVDGQIHLFNHDTKIDGKVKFLVEDLNSDFTLWDVTDFKNISVQKTFDETGKSAFIVDNENKLLRFLVFKNGSEKLPEMVGKVENQNLHAQTPVDYIIITHPDFKAQAEKLAKFHENREGYTYLITYPEKIYNEFSSGALDITAIRDFVKMIYDRETVTAKKPKALLLLGDASFDYKNRNNSNGNMVPTFESYEYNLSISSHCSDDYYVILDDTEGRWAKSPGTFQELMDMGVGRLPAKSVYEAEVMVDKCIHYKTASDKGEWRSSITFLADDEDHNTHFEDSEKLAETCDDEFPPLNINKIYFDSYKQVSLGNGNSYPEVNDAINNSIAKGTLVFNYLGHGGGSGMGHERVVTRPMILEWKNYDKLCFFITGTCDLAQFDNPKEESPGELMMTNSEGGAIGMMTTTRKVYIGLNTAFSEYLFKNNLFKRDGDHFTTFGQAYANVKNEMWNSVNVRNYIMFGDPLLDLNLPVQKTIITKINGNPVSINSKDTLKALSKVEIEGNVTNISGSLLTDFNGDVSVTLFDKKQTFKTLGNDPESSVLPFSVRNNVLYRGKASVKNGVFKVAFILPKDIDYSMGKGRIFTYAYNDKTDAVGIADSTFVGGTASLIAADSIGPLIDIFLEDERFVSGGIVSNKPLLIVKLWDENGINTAGNGVGREILGVLDKGSEASKNYILNDFYSTTLDSYQGGEVRIRLSELAPGQHTLLVRAWDVYNNSSEGMVDFLVATDENMAIRNLLNYPNPFTTKTNIHFDHNKAGQELSVAINIFSISGRVVKTLYAKIPNASSHVSDIEWDGKDEYGGNLGRGVYMYKIKVRSEDGKTEEEIQKMVLLK